MPKDSKKEEETINLGDDLLNTALTDHVNGLDEKNKKVDFLISDTYELVISENNKKTIELGVNSAAKFLGFTMNNNHLRLTHIHLKELNKRFATLVAYKNNSTSEDELITDWFKVLILDNIKIKSFQTKFLPDHLDKNIKKVTQLTHVKTVNHSVFEESETPYQGELVTGYYWSNRSNSGKSEHRHSQYQFYLLGITIDYKAQTIFDELNIEYPKS